MRRGLYGLASCACTAAICIELSLPHINRGWVMFDVFILILNLHFYFKRQ